MFHAKNFYLYASLLVLCVASTAKAYDNDGLSISTLPRTNVVDGDLLRNQARTDDDEPCDEHGSILPHFRECAKFYVCVFGIRVPMSCAEGTQFDFQAGVCLPNEDAVCAPGSRRNDVDEEGSGDEEPFNPCENNEGAFFPSREDCYGFLVCENGRFTHMKCAPGTAFNPAIGNCDWKTNVDCVGRGDGSSVAQTLSRSSRQAESTVNLANEGSEETDEDGSGEVETTKTPNICVGWNDGALIRYPGSCADYFICDHSVAKPRRCASGTVFNPAIEQCDWPRNVPECQRSCEGVPNGSLSMDPMNCRKYFICDNGVKKTRQCAAGTAFNPLINNCDWPENVQCDE